MIKALFLSCALVLPLTNFGGEEYLKQFEELSRFIWKQIPDAEIYINSIDHEKPEGLGWERLPFKWNDHFVWIRRPDFTDRSA